VRRERSVNPSSSVPTLIIDAEPVIGFGPVTVARALVRAAERRAGG